eukprot:CAMPEP_0117558880 /NCGR_PEP_ID=MMETSP0784-20121206/53072_1 /TAXON_ID=39447 /ORGANISM="" /LENGTH=337 /DNA_ID=CAMNT_0005356239 /DNA_START=43 /DNA_END=1057 /DNA_ORIENTATION=+
MVEPYFAHGVEVRGGNLVRSKAEPDGPDAVVVFDVPSTDEFELSLRISTEDCEFNVGIAADSIAYPPFKGPLWKRGYFLFLTDDMASLYASDDTEGGEVPCQLETPPKKGQVVRLAYTSEPRPTLSFAFADGQLLPVKFDEDIPAGDYRPCIIINTQETELEVLSVSGMGRPRKRRRDERLMESSRRMWVERRFTDAEIVCDGRSDIPSAPFGALREARVFVGLFEGGCQESNTAHVDMSGEDPAALAALLEHAYTAELPAGTDPIRLLPLADRYEIFDCVDDCAESIARIAKWRPVDALRALRPYSEDKRLKYTWERVCRAVMSDFDLCMTVFKSL